MSKNVLVLSTLDERGAGHGLFQARRFRNFGFNVDLVCLLRTHKSSEEYGYIIDTLNPFSIRNIFYKVGTFLNKLLFFKHPGMRAMYRGIDYANDRDVLKRLKYNPDYIILCTYQNFLSPKSIYNLWKTTKAEIYLVMVDEKVLGGGCAYPIGCRNYEIGCTGCPIYPYAAFFPKFVYGEKDKYFSRIPMNVCCSGYDYNKAKNVSFLKNKKFITYVTAPKIPFRMNKRDARMKMDLPQDRFIIMAGAVSIANPYKGFAELMDSIEKFATQADGIKPLFVLAGTNVKREMLPSNIEVVLTGFLDQQQLFTLYYASDVYTSPSIEDSGPMMVNFAVACGRPVIAFPVGVAVDLIDHKKTGYIAELKNTDEFAAGIKYFYDLKIEELDIVQSNCISKIKEASINTWYKDIVDSLND